MRDRFRSFQANLEYLSFIAFFSINSMLDHLQIFFRIYYLFYFRLGGLIRKANWATQGGIEGTVGVDVTCFFGVSRKNGIGQYANWFVQELINSNSDLLFFCFRNNEVIRLRLIQTLNGIEFENIQSYRSIELMLEYIGVAKIIFLSPFEENVPSLAFGRIRSQVILYDLIPLFRPWQFKNRNSRNLYIKKLKQLTRAEVLVISEHTRSEFRRLFPHHLKSYLIPFHIDRYLARQFSSEQNTSGSVVVFGGKDPRKNLKLVISCWRSAKLSATNKLVVIGQVPIGAKIRELLQLSNVEFVGDISNLERDRILATCYLVICPSLNEGLGLPLLEAASNGKAVIYSHIPSHLEWIESGGISFNPKSKKQFRKILNLIEAGNLISPLVLKNQADSITHFLRRT